MANATSFESILDTPADKIERPKPLPAGTYGVVVRGLPEHGVSSQKKTPFVRFTYALVAAGDDVDEDELKELLTDKEGNIQPIGSKTIRDTYYTTPDSMFRLTDCLATMGLDIDQPGVTVRQLIDATPNCDLNILVGHRASEDGTQVFAEVKRTMKAE